MAFIAPRAETFLFSGGEMFGGNESEAMGHAPFAARRIIFICVFFAAVRGYRANRMFRMRDCKSRALVARCHE